MDNSVTDGSTKFKQAANSRWSNDCRFTIKPSYPTSHKLNWYNQVSNTQSIVSTDQKITYNLEQMCIAGGYNVNITAVGLYN